MNEDFDEKCVCAGAAECYFHIYVEHFMRWNIVSKKLYLYLKSGKLKMCLG